MSASYSLAGARTWPRPAAIAVGMVLGAMVVLTAVGLAQAKGWSAVSGACSFSAAPSWRAVEASVWHGLRLSILGPWYWSFVLLLTIIQWVRPARDDERTLSVDVAVDAVWFVMGNVMQLTVVAVALGSVTVAYSALFGDWSLAAQDVLGTGGLAVLAFVLTDGLAWCSHWCHHKVATLWRFHAVHHSQRRLNALSDNRTHVGEVVAAALIVFVPSRVLGLDSSTALSLSFIGIYYSAMLHSNIRTNPRAAAVRVHGTASPPYPSLGRSPLLRPQLRHRLPVVGFHGPDLSLGCRRIPGHGHHRRVLSAAGPGGLQSLALARDLHPAAAVSLGRHLRVVGVATLRPRPGCGALGRRTVGRWHDRLPSHHADDRQRGRPDLPRRELVDADGVDVEHPRMPAPGPGPSTGRRPQSPVR